MIVVRVQGGLGNQLFQYALACSLSYSNNIEVVLDTSFYNGIFGDDKATKRQFLLTKFMITEMRCIQDTDLVLQKDLISKGKRFLERVFLPYYKCSYIRERKKSFDQNIFKISRNAYLDGYWQSYLYFNEISNQLKDHLRLSHPFSFEAQQIFNLIRKDIISVSIHIRRTDYVTKYNTYYAILDVDYYKKAVDYLIARVGKVNLYVFSDDIDWCKNNLKIEQNTIFVSSGSMAEEEEFVIMSQCKHNIIANSTFSWWAAWLNPNPDKIVVAPTKWFAENDVEFSKSIYPQSWICL